MRRTRSSLSLLVALFILVVAMPACKTLDSVLNKKDSTETEAKEEKKVKKTATKKAPKPTVKKSEPAKAKKKVNKEVKQEAEVVEAPVYEPPLRGSPKSRVGGGTR